MENALKDSVHVFIVDLSMISHSNAKLIISTLEAEQCTFHEPQFAYISVIFMFTHKTHFQDRHTHFHSTFAFSEISLTNQARSLYPIQVKYF